MPAPQRAYMVVSPKGDVDGIGVESAWAGDTGSQEMIADGWDLIWTDLDYAAPMFGEKIAIDLKVIEEDDEAR